jgi:cyclic beta-1,2-glucan synthetase
MHSPTVLESMIESVEALERYEGHLLNWYDTTTLAPLLPRYVSTVDSGNLAASLMTLASGLRQLATDTTRTSAGAQAPPDTCGVLTEAVSGAVPQGRPRFGPSELTRRRPFET